MSKKRCTSERKSQLISIKIWQVFDGLNQGFGGVANTIIGIVAAELSVAVHLIAGLSTRQWLANNCETQMASLTSQRG